MSNPNGKAYAGVVASTAFEAAATGAWVMAGELTTAKRRLVRASLTATVAGIGLGLFRLAPEGLDEPEDEDLEDDPDDEPLGDGLLGDRSLAPSEQNRPESARSASARANPFLGLVAGGIAIGIMIGSSMLQKRWLVALERAGHSAPHRALALRVAAVSFAGTLPARLMEVHERADASTPPGVQ